MTQEPESGAPGDRNEFGRGVHGTAIISGVTFGPRSVVYSEIDGVAVFEGDIELGTVEEIRGQRIESAGAATAAGISLERYRWPGGLIPYEIDPALPDRRRVTDAIAHWEEHTGIRFVPRDRRKHANFVRFVPGDACRSSVGMRVGGQTVLLGPECSTGNAIHEIGHTVGLWHEQSREDRDRYVRIIKENIAPEAMPNFLQQVTDGDDLGEYDYGSIMHYPRNAFSANGGDTIVPVRPNVRIGQRKALSAGDIAGVRQMYAEIVGAASAPST
jgi:hypothetical protein